MKRDKTRYILRRARIRAGLTQEELAHRIGVTQAAISLWERGKREPRLEAALLLARELKIPPRDLLMVFRLGPWRR